MDELKTKKQIKEEIAEAYEKLEERLIYEDYIRKIRRKINL